MGNVIRMPEHRHNRRGLEEEEREKRKGQTIEKMVGNSDGRLASSGCNELERNGTKWIPMEKNCGEDGRTLEDFYKL